MYESLWVLGLSEMEVKRMGERWAYFFPPPTIYFITHHEVVGVEDHGYWPPDMGGGDGIIGQASEGHIKAPVAYMCEYVCKD
jgi:hypothetical protein